MISGTSKVLATTMLSLAIATGSVPSRAAPEPDAAAIVGKLRRAAPATTPYTEVRFSGLLDRPLILHGTLEYLGPRRLAKTVDEPYRERTVIENGEASVQRGDKPARTFSLGQAPELEGFLRGFSALLGGDAAGIARDFKMKAGGGATAWTLELKPRDDRLARRIDAIEVDGNADGARCFSTHEADGDLNVLLVEALAKEHLPPHPSPAMIDALCRGIDH